MNISLELQQALTALFHASAQKNLSSDDYKDLCRAAKVSRMYYDINLGEPGRYRDQRTNKLVLAEKECGDKIILYDDGRDTCLKKKYTYYYNGADYVHAWVEFPVGTREEDLDWDLYQYLSDIVYDLESRKNMRRMLDFAEMTDMQTGIPNAIQMYSVYGNMIRTIPPEKIDVLYVNLRNFKFINESAGAPAGDEAIVRYSRQLMKIIGENEFVCRMGGDNFVFLTQRENFAELEKKLRSIRLTDLNRAPNRNFDIGAWIGVSRLESGEKKSLQTRIEEASNACRIGKSRLKQPVVFFNDQINRMMGSRQKVIGLFRPALKNREFLPYFQPKVDMRTGELRGFEALCRWIHEGQFILPDQFIPVLDREGMIHELDITIFRITCESIRRWRDMGLNPPRISTNFSRKNLFVPHIERMILDIVKEAGISTQDVEIEITETVQESEFNRLMAFVHRLKEAGLHISVDDFGTGYSSLSMIQNIDADAIKIDKSFVDEAPKDKRSDVLIDSIAHLASKLDMDIVAEGVETVEQGMRLMEYGCYTAQGFYYSRPVSFEEATEIIRNPQFKPIVQMKTHEASTPSIPERNDDCQEG